MNLCAVRHYIVFRRRQHIELLGPPVVSEPQVLKKSDSTVAAQQQEI